MLILWIRKLGTERISNYLLSPSQKAELGHHRCPVSPCPVSGVEPQSPEPHLLEGERDMWFYLVTHWCDPDLSLKQGEQASG